MDINCGMLVCTTRMTHKVWPDPQTLSRPLANQGGRRPQPFGLQIHGLVRKAPLYLLPQYHHLCNNEGHCRKCLVICYRQTRNARNMSDAMILPTASISIRSLSSLKLGAGSSPILTSNAPCMNTAGIVEHLRQRLPSTLELPVDNMLGQ